MLQEVKCKTGFCNLHAPVNVKQSFAPAESACTSTSSCWKQCQLHHKMSRLASKQSCIQHLFKWNIYGGIGEEGSGWRYNAYGRLSTSFKTKHLWEDRRVWCLWAALKAANVPHKKSPSFLSRGALICQSRAQHMMIFSCWEKIEHLKTWSCL